MVSAWSEPVPVRHPPRLATRVVEEVVHRITSGVWAPGTIMPTEPRLMEEFAVSRSVLREAIKAAEGMRLLRAVQGQGTTVRRPEEWDLMHPTVLASCVNRPDHWALLDDLVDVRRALEAQMAGQAAVRHESLDREAVRASFEAMNESMSDPDEFIRHDIYFHDAIHAASRNRLGRAAVRTLTQETERSIRYVGDPDFSECQISNEEHRVIMDAVFHRDEERSAQLMNDHILHAWLRRRPHR